VPERGGLVDSIRTEASLRNAFRFPHKAKSAMLRVEANIMPTYEYELCDGVCRICRGPFTIQRPISAPALEKCPLCKKPVRKIFSQVNVPKVTAPVSASDAKNAGFTMYKKIGNGEYERQ
jgi:putative FmdB family regulatory protein